MFDKNSYSIKEKNVLLVTGLLFVIFLIFRIVSQNYYLEDSLEYLEIAKSIASLTYFNDNIDYTLLTKRPFFYPLILAFFYRFHIVILLIFQTVVSFFSILILFDILKFYKITIKPYFTFFFLFTPSIFIYSQLVMSEWILFFLIILLFWLLIKGWNKKYFVYVQIITVLLAFTKPVFYPFIFINFIYFFFYFLKSRVFSFWLFFPILSLFLYLNYNEYRTGYKHFSSIENINLINYNLYYFKSFTTSEKQARQWKDSVYDAKFQKMDFREQNENLKSIGFTEIKDNFISYSFYHTINALRGVLDPGRFDLMTFFKKEDGKQGFLEILNGTKSFSSLSKNPYFLIYILLIPIFLFAIFKWFYFSKGLLALQEDFYVYYIVLLFFYYIIVTGPINCSRFMMPVQGIAFVIAVLGFEKHLKNRKL